MSLSLAIGVVGAGFLLLGFILNQLDVLKNSTLSYNVINFVGSVLFVIYSWMLKSWPFFVMNLVWSFVSLRGIVNSFTNEPTKK